MSASPLSDDVLKNVSGGTEVPYVVLAGDTAESIARKFHCTVEQLCLWNNIHNPGDIKPNQKLIIRF